MNDFKFNIGDAVVIINKKAQYCNYINFILKYANEYKDLFTVGDYIQPYKIYTIIAKGLHTSNKDKRLYIVKPIFKNKIYIIGEEGIEKYI